MNPAEQKTMMEDAQSRATREHEIEVRKYRIVENLKKLGLNSDQVTGWFDESKYEGKSMATRIKQEKVDGQGFSFVIQVGVAEEGTTVGQTPEGTFVYTYADVVFASFNAADSKVTAVHEITHHDGVMTRGTALDPHNNKFQEVEYTISRAAELKDVGRLGVADS